MSTKPQYAEIKQGTTLWVITAYLVNHESMDQPGNEFTPHAKLMFNVQGVMCKGRPYVHEANVMVTTTDVGTTYRRRVHPDVKMVINTERLILTSKDKTEPGVFTTVTNPWVFKTRRAAERYAKRFIIDADYQDSAMREAARVLAVYQEAIEKAVSDPTKKPYTDIVVDPLMLKKKPKIPVTRVFGIQPRPDQLHYNESWTRLTGKN